jgi:RNA polymerase-interacting CarD/CdnL/TRCF family regulator
MTKLREEITEVYDKLDCVRELLEFDNPKGKNEKALKALDDARDALNRYLAVVEKFDRTGKKK